MVQETEFDKYKKKGAYHWEDANRSIFKFNAVQEARFEWVLRVLGDVKDKKILDIGCGDGALTYRIAEKGADIIGVDNSKEGIQLAEEIFEKKKISAQFLLADAYNIPVDNNSMNCVVLSDIIEHIQEPERLLKEAKRVLKQNGKIVISTPYKFGENLWDKYHVKEYYPNELKSLLESDFNNIEIFQSHPALWFFPYTYSSRWTFYRPVFKWLINIVSLIGFNPFLKHNERPKRFDRFIQLTAVAFKK